MYESDFAWLLKILSQSQLDLNIVYGIRMKIPEIVLFNAGEPKYWYYQDKVNPERKSFTERRNVPQTQNNEGILDPSAFGDLDGYTDFDFMMYKEQKQNDLPDNTILFCVHIEQKNKGISLFKKIKKKIADDLFRAPSDYMDYFLHWTKVISYIPNKDAGLYDIFLYKSLQGELKYKIFRRDFSLKDIETSDFSKSERDRLAAIKTPTKRDDATLSKINYLSVATPVNSQLEKFAKSIMRYVEGKTKRTIGELHLEVILDAKDIIWLIGSRGIYFYNDEGEVDKKMDKESIDFPKTTFTKHVHCPGAYCKFFGETNFREEGDEATELYGVEIISTVLT